MRRTPASLRDIDGFQPPPRGDETSPTTAVRVVHVPSANPGSVADYARLTPKAQTQKSQRELGLKHANNPKHWVAFVGAWPDGTPLQDETKVINVRCSPFKGGALLPSKPWCRNDDVRGKFSKPTGSHPGVLSHGSPLRLAAPFAWHPSRAQPEPSSEEQRRRPWTVQKNTESSPRGECQQQFSDASLGVLPHGSPLHGEEKSHSPSSSPRGETRLHTGGYAGVLVRKNKEGSPKGQWRRTPRQERIRLGNHGLASGVLSHGTPLVGEMLDASSRLHDSRAT